MNCTILSNRIFLVAEYWGTEDHSKIVDVPYQRYPRTFVPPPSIELTLHKNEDGDAFLVAPTFELTKNEPESLIHAINVFLEIFGYCEVFAMDLVPFASTKPVRLNWNILPPGKWPWEKREKEVEPIMPRLLGRIKSS